MNDFNHFRDLIVRVSKAYMYPMDLLAAQCAAESAFNPRAVSPVGAKGLMQFMPATWGDWGLGGDPFDPLSSLDAGCRYMVWLLDKFKTWDSPIEAALAAYNHGIGNVRRARNKSEDTDSLLSPTSWQNLRRLVPEETRKYVEKILADRGKYADLLSCY